MSNKHAEELCAMMDGELGHSESLFLVKRMGNEQQLMARWRRYHYSRAVLRGDAFSAQVCLRARIAGVIAEEPTPTLEHTVGSAFLPAWLRPVAGMAVAASVAVGAFALLQTEHTTPVSEATTISAAAPVVDRSPTVPLRAQPASASSLGGNSRLQAYVMRHNAVATPRRGRNLVPYIYLVTTPVPVNEAAREISPAAESTRTDEASAGSGVKE